MCVGEAASVCGEEYKKEGEEIVFCCCRAEGEIIMRYAFGVLWSLAPIPPGARLFGPSLHNPREVYRTPTVRAVVWF